MRKKIACIVGARPNFMKIAPILRAMKFHENLQPILIHTGQHYDKYQSDIFFEELGIDPPDIALGIGSGTHAKQTADIMVAMENVLLEANEKSEPFHRVVVVGDVNSTAATAIAAVKLHIPVAHVEAGLRSRDRRMPEEINRVITDAICDMLLVSEPSGIENLKREGHPDDQVHLVGNVMIDTLMSQVERARATGMVEKIGFKPGQYGVITLHRPSNVDHAEILESLIEVIRDISAEMPFVFPIHPRTKARLESFDLLKKLESCQNVKCLDPIGYLDFLNLTSQAKVICTDSGGLQEESTALLVPCLTLRENTERPITCSEGTSTLIGNDAAKLKQHLRDVIDGTYKTGKCPELWDGKASERIATILAQS